MTETIINQWGSSVRPFSAYENKEKKSLVAETSMLIREIKRQLGIDCMLSYGGLLGAVRDGRLIPNDFDIDVVFISKESNPTQILKICGDLISFLRKCGYDVQADTNGQFKAIRRENGKLLFVIEFFAAWIDGDKFFQYFGVRGALIADKIFPLNFISLEGESIAAPCQPEVLLAAIYGSNWQTPDPTFRYELTAKNWEPFKFLFFNGNKSFWETYYEKSAQNQVFVTRPSQFTSFFMDNSVPGSSVLEFGCGNGRDGLYLATMGYDMTLVDYSTAAIQICHKEAEKRSLSVRAETLNISDISSAIDFVNANSGRFGYIYTRFFLHAINELSEWNFFNLANVVLQPGGYIFAEYRSSGGEPYQYENGQHYRRLISEDEICRSAAVTGFLVDYIVTSRGFSKYKSEDPLVTRVILRRNNSSKNRNIFGSQKSSSAPQGVCPICCGYISKEYTEPTREKRVCQSCRATGRDCAIANLISKLSGYDNVPLKKINVNKGIYIGNMSGSKCLSNALEHKFSYLNTYYHKYPKFDLQNPSVDFAGKFDILINSEVLEYVIGDTINALKGAFFSLKPGGWMIFSVPFVNTGSDMEYYPGLVSYEEIPTNNGKRSAKLYFESGRVKIDTDAKFHGGSDSTLELRLFNRTRLLSELEKAGFESIIIHEQDHPEIGIKWGAASRMVTARRPVMPKLP